MSGAPGPIRILSVDDQRALGQGVVKPLLSAAVIFAFSFAGSCHARKEMPQATIEFTQTDTSGALHMQIKKKSDRWSCAEIFLIPVSGTTRLTRANLTLNP